MDNEMTFFIAIEADRRRIDSVPRSWRHLRLTSLIPHCCHRYRRRKDVRQFSTRSSKEEVVKRAESVGSSASQISDEVCNAAVLI